MKQKIYIYIIILFLVSLLMEVNLINKSFDSNYKTIETNAINEKYNDLINLGYSIDEINKIYDKLDDETIDTIKNIEYNKNIVDYITLDYFIPSNINRYINYQNNNTELNYEQIVTQVNIGLDNDYYTNINNISNEDASNINILVNKYNKLDENYVPDNLTKIETKYATDNQYMQINAHDAFIKMCEDAIKENIYIYAGSTYRSYSYQDQLYNKYVLENTFDIAERFSARPGHSEHQTGLAVDILNKQWEYIKENNEEYSWLLNNSYKYGFILRYPKEKENITGYMFESWHFRYLDLDIAKTLYENNITYDEYIAKNIKNNS